MAVSHDGTQGSVVAGAQSHGPQVQFGSPAAHPHAHAQLPVSFGGHAET
jgi:hypothetical protein